MLVESGVLHGARRTPPPWEIGSLLLVYIPEDSVLGSMPRIGRGPAWLKFREELQTLELTMEPPENGEDAVAVAPVNDKVGVSLFLLPFGLPGPCLLFLPPLRFFSFTFSSPSPAASGEVRL